MKPLFRSETQEIGWSSSSAMNTFLRFFSINKMRTEFQVWTHKELSVGQHFKLIKPSFKLVTLKKRESNHTAGKRFTCFLLKLKKLRGLV